MAVPARCRICKTRRSLKKHTDEYIRKPRCKVPGCGGLMVVDKTRNEGRDKGDTCYDDCRPYPHSKTDIMCKRHTDYVIEKSLIVYSKLKEVGF